MTTTRNLFLAVCILLGVLQVNGLDDWELGPFVKQDNINPILTPKNETSFHCPVHNRSIHWENKDVFNPTALVINGTVHLLYRAEDDVGENMGTSRVGLGISKDGLTFERQPEPIFFPINGTASFIYEWDGGCEDPRIVESDAGDYILTYTGYDGEIARLLIATSKDLKNWTFHGPVFGKVEEGKYIDMWSKSGSIVTKRVGERYVAEKINGKYWMYWGDTHMFIATSDNLIDWTPLAPENPEDGHGTWNLTAVFSPRPDYFDSDLVEPGPQAFIRNDGILLIYNSRNHNETGDKTVPDWTYTAGQALMNLTNPAQVLKRSNTYFMRPEKDYELIGQIGNVVFLEGLVEFKGTWYVYYGTADSKIAVATYRESSSSVMLFANYALVICMLLTYFGIDK